MTFTFNYTASPQRHSLTFSDESGVLYAHGFGDGVFALQPGEINDQLHSAFSTFADLVFAKQQGNG